MENSDIDDIDMDIDTLETLKDAYELGHITEERYKRIRKLMKLEEKAQTPFEKVAVRHYLLEHVVDIMTKQICELKDRIEDLENE